MKNIALLVTTPPNSHLTKTAYQFALDVLASEHHLIGVFFYQQGVINGGKYISFPSDEVNVQHLWQELNKDHQLSLHLCSTAAEKFGLFPAEIVNPETELAEGFSLSGLGELAALINKADKLVQL